MLPELAFEPDAVTAVAGGSTWFTSGSQVLEVTPDGVRPVADLGAAVTALDGSNDGAVCAVASVGLVHLSKDGRSSLIADDTVLRSCVTDITVADDDTVFATVGSRLQGVDGWARSLVSGDRSGCLLSVRGGTMCVLAEDLGWPSGVAQRGGDLLVAVSHDHRLEIHDISTPSKLAETFLSNTPFYPGRLSSTAGGWWLAAPYLRNRLTELILQDDALLQDMVATLPPDDWFVPRLVPQSPYRSPLQVGEIRVMGIAKPWAPTRHYGLAVRLSADARIEESFHSSSGARRQGVTSIIQCGDRIVLAARACSNLIEIRRAANDA